MKNVLLVVCVLATASVATAALGDVDPTGLTGLWRFESALAGGDATMAATIGTDMVSPQAPANGQYFTGPWTDLGVPAAPGLYSDNGAAQMRSNNEFQVFHGISPNGGGTYVNEYTIVMDYVQTSHIGSWNSLYQTATGAHDNDGDLWTSPTGQLGVGELGYSTLTYDPSTWHRITLSVDNGSFYRAYVDGALIFDNSTGANGVDGRFSLNNNFWLLADNDWEDRWGLVGTVAVWNRALGSAEIADLGGWIDGASMPTPLVLVPEPATMLLLGLGSLVAIRRKK